MSETDKELLALVLESLDDLKANDVRSIEVTEKTDIADFMVIASGTSNRHVKALVNNVVQDAKAKDIKPLGVEGLEDGEWVLVDLGDVLVHVMLPTARDFYDLERLWTLSAEKLEETRGGEETS